MIWNSDGMKVEQVEINGLEKPTKCCVCGRTKRGDQKCKRDKHKHLINLYVRNEYEINT